MTTWRCLLSTHMAIRAAPSSPASCGLERVARTRKKWPIWERRVAPSRATVTLTCLVESSFLLCTFLAEACESFKGMRICGSRYNGKSSLIQDPERSGSSTGAILFKSNGFLAQHQDSTGLNAKASWSESKSFVIHIQNLSSKPKLCPGMRSLVCCSHSACQTHTEVGPSSRPSVFACQTRTITANQTVLAGSF